MLGFDPIDVQIVKAVHSVETLVTLIVDPDDAAGRFASSQMGSLVHAGTLPEPYAHARHIRWTRRGIEVADAIDGEPVRVLTWAAIRRWVRGLDPALRAALAGWRQRWRQHQASYPVFHATGEAVGCGPFPAVGPLTYGQHLYREQEKAWEPRHEAWRKQQAALREEARATLAAVDEPVLF